MDDRSSISPTPILDEWRKSFGMDIIQWNNSDYMKNIKDFDSLTPNQQVQFYLSRQNTFVIECMKHFKRNNQKWVMFTDIDEYLLFGGAPSSTATETEDSIVTYPSVNERGSLLSFLEEEVHRKGTTYSSPCIFIPRTMVGTREDREHVPQHNFSDTLTSSSLNLTKFDTLQYRVHAKQDDVKPFNGHPKVIIDLSRVNYTEIPPSARSIHNPLPDVCGNIWLSTCKGKACMFRINHYLGSWESYSYRSNGKAETS